MNVASLMYQWCKQSLLLFVFIAHVFKFITSHHIVCTCIVPHIVYVKASDRGYNKFKNLLIIDRQLCTVITSEITGVSPKGEWFVAKRSFSAGIVASAFVVAHPVDS